MIFLARKVGDVHRDSAARALGRGSSGGPAGNGPRKRGGRGRSSSRRASSGRDPWSLGWRVATFPMVTAPGRASRVGVTDRRRRPRGGDRVRRPLKTPSSIVVSRRCVRDSLNLVSLRTWCGGRDLLRQWGLLVESDGALDLRQLVSLLCKILFAASSRFLHTSNWRVVGRGRRSGKDSETRSY